jgi:hypothetical protein
MPTCRARGRQTPHLRGKVGRAAVWASRDSRLAAWNMRGTRTMSMSPSWYERPALSTYRTPFFSRSCRAYLTGSTQCVPRSRMGELLPHAFTLKLSCASSIRAGHVRRLRVLLRTYSVVVWCRRSPRGPSRASAERSDDSHIMNRYMQRQEVLVLPGEHAPMAMGRCRLGRG